MALIHETIPGLYDGVSQQPPPARSPAQCEEAGNVLFDVALGATKRPPTKHIAKLGDTDVGSSQLHVINRDADERYIVGFNGGVVRVWRLSDGVELTVNAPQGWSYAVSSDPLNDIRAVTVADFTFVVNRSVLPSMLVGSDSGGNYKGTVQSFRKLDDLISVDIGEVHEVIGDEVTAFTSYYVIHEGNRRWRETVKPGIDNSFNNFTMPWVLVREADGTFTFRPQEWESRKTGDETTNPAPSFIGKPIEDVFFHRNRLGFISGSNVVMSASGSYFDFWRDTVVDLLDTHPIDVAVSHNSVARLQYAVPFNKTLLLVGNGLQFALNGQQILSPKTVSFDQTTAYDTFPQVRPVPAGPNLYFAAPKGSWTAVLEYFVDEDSVTDKAADVTAHVPQYISNNPRCMAASSNMSMLFITTNDEPFSIYTYSWYWAGQERAQSAWGRWYLGGRVRAMESLDTDLILIVQYDDGTYLEKLSMEPGTVSFGAYDTIHLDRQVLLEGTYNGSGTTFTLPFPVPVSQEVQVIRTFGHGVDQAGALVLPGNVSRPTDTTVYVSGMDETNGGIAACILGVPYQTALTLTQLFPSGGKTKTLAGRLTIRNLIVYYANAGYFRVVIKRQGRPDSDTHFAPDGVVNFTGRTVGLSTLGTPQLSEGYHRFPIFGDTRTTTITLFNDGPHPCHWQRLDWEGSFTARARIR